MYSNLRQALLDLEKAGMLRRIHEEVDPYLEMSEMARQAFDNGGPALLFEKIKGSKFMAAANIFGTRERMDFLFRDTIKGTKTAVQFKADPVAFFKHASPAKLLQAASTGIRALPCKSGSIKDFEECSLEDLPQIVSWPDDGGAFLTLPQVATRPSDSASVLQTNLGMYRVQISGNDYASNECGLHYQIKRDIARHHQKAIEDGRPLKVSVFLGGPPAHTIAAVMPMPENLSELTFAGMLAGKRFRYFIHDDYLISSDAEFCILGELAPDLKPEGPFGDHVGYYSGKHPFPYMKVHKVLCKKNAIFPFTAVGRPPKEDTIFGEFIHKITEPMVPTSIPGVHAVHAVDAAGVHPLCLALASERFIPYADPEKREPMELLKTANALLGFNQVSLSKYLMVAAKEDNPQLDVNDVPSFFKHVLERVNFARDLHFQTATTIDTLDYTGTSLNHGSKLVIAAAGPKRRELRNSEADLESLSLPQDFGQVSIPMAGALMIEGPAYPSNLGPFIKALEHWEFRENYPWISIVDHEAYAGLNDFLWLTFTRSDPAQDIYGIDEKITQKHWSIEPPLIVDARQKPRHQKPLSVSKSVIAKASEILKKSTAVFCLCFILSALMAPSASAYHCGTSHIFENSAIKKQSRPMAKSYYDGVCTPDVFYDSVYTLKTKHFEIFYTLNGPHATTQNYIDSVASNFEKAWDFHVNKSGMRKPLGSPKTYHYQKEVESDLYPIEVVDINQIRDLYSILSEDWCNSCFGLTVPINELKANQTQIFLDNDFQYTPEYPDKFDSVKVESTYCKYPVANVEIWNTTHNYSYKKNWANGIRVTAFHELYHASQLRYLDMYKHRTFWFEASASGIEEVTAPDIDDYIASVSQSLKSTGIPVSNFSSPYGAGILFLYLYNHYDKRFDKDIWERFSKKPEEDFQYHLTASLKAKDKSADSIFHDFATKLSFSGTRSSFIDSAKWIASDQAKWGNIHYDTVSSIPSLLNFSYKFSNSNEISTQDFYGRISAALYKNGHADIMPAANTGSLDSIRTQMVHYDSVAWILSRFNEETIFPEYVKDSTLRAYPMPWRGGNLCFTPLPSNKDFIEVRNRRGNLVFRESYTQTTHCIDESQVKSKMKPGLYRFRAGASGKTKDFLVIY